MPGSRGQEEVLWKVLGSSNWPILVWSHLWYIVGKGSGLTPVGAEDCREFCWSGQGGRQTREGLSYTRGNQPGQAAQWGEETVGVGTCPRCCLPSLLGKPMKSMSPSESSASEELPLFTPGTWHTFRRSH